MENLIKGKIMYCLYKITNFTDGSTMKNYFGSLKLTGIFPHIEMQCSPDRAMKFKTKKDANTFMDKHWTKRLYKIERTKESK